MKKIIIRVDSSAQIGSGHLMRCLTLAEQRRQDVDNEIYFISRDLENNLNDLIIRRGFSLKLLQRHEIDLSLKGYAAWLTVPQEVDAEETIKILKTLGTVDELIIDSYAIDINWEKLIRPYVKKIFVIDDLANRKHDCDILLDQNFHEDIELAKERYLKLVPENCELRIGLKYTLLRQEFYDAKKNLRYRDGRIKNILVFYGGSDLTNETMKALRALVNLNLKNVTVNVVVGGSNSQREVIEKFCSQHGFNFYYQVNNMAELMNAADLALGAGGATTLERLFLQLPAIVTAVADNQIEICENYSREGYIKYLGVYENVTVDDISRAVENLLSENNLRNILDTYHKKTFGFNR